MRLFLPGRARAANADLVRADFFIIMILCRYKTSLGGLQVTVESKEKGG